MGRLSTLLTVSALLAACRAPNHDTNGLPAAPAAPLSSESIGSATMTADGTIVLDLRAESPGAHGDARLVYPRSHPEYEKILAHLGGLKPGEQKPVRPWP
jgi:hypothetical protein